TYSISVHNGGPSDATGVVVSDTLPAGVAFVSATTGCVNSSGTVTCPVGALASGADSTVIVVVTGPLATGTVTNTARVSGSPADPCAATNSASASTTVHAAPSADLSIMKSAPVPVTTRLRSTYSISVHNGGPSDATGVVVSDTLPAGVAFVSASTGCVNSSGSVTCTIGALANGADSTAMIVVTAPSATGTVTNSATVAGSPSDPNSANNTASASTTVPAALAADTSITQAAPVTVTPGQSFPYSLSVPNGGPSAPPGAVPIDTLPAGVGFVSASTGCVNSSGTVTCTVGALANGVDSTAMVV